MTDNNLFSNKFTTHLKGVLLNAGEKAANLLREKELDALNNKEKKYHSINTYEITNSIILEALEKESGSIACEILKKTKYSVKENIKKLKTSPKKIDIDSVTLSAQAADSIIKAVQISHQYRHKYIGTEHLLKSLIQSKDPDVIAWWEKNKINIIDVEKNLQIVLESTSKFPDLTAVFRTQESKQLTKDETKQTALEYFGQELTDLNIQKDIDPVIGRDIEIERLIQVLCRRYKNNPLLLGEAGVGKTAIVEGLAKRISQGNVPPILANKKIYTIDLGAMISGTIYRGEFEARLKNALEVAQKDGNTILFIDEIHTIIGAGSASGSLDAANILKPALARGTISIIGATTLEEYKKHIETDSALERRMQPILIEEPSEDETIEVLGGIKKNYESFHNVVITDEAINAAVKLSSRYMPEKLQPDKSIDLIDEAAARVKVERSKQSIWHRIRETETQIEATNKAKQRAVIEEQYSDAIKLKNKIKELQTSLEMLHQETKLYNAEKVEVGENHIIHIVSSLTKIPLGILSSNEKERLGSIENKIKENIIGQDRALETIANLIRRARTNVADPKKPIASFMFFGPSGVGKTETAKQLARHYFDSEKAIIRVDMSEFSEGYSVSRLVGSPAGYVGYRDSNKFTDLVRKTPYSVVLLDEIEKANPEVFNLLLQILEDGHLTDAVGRTVNFKNTIIIMTSNLGLDEFSKAEKLGFGTDKTNFDSIEKNVLKEIQNHFRPEFLNRVDKTIVFNPLTEENFAQITKLYAKELNNRLLEENIQIELSPSSQKHIVKKGYEPDSGARGVRKYFQDNIESEVAKLLLKRTSQKKQHIKINAEKDNLTFKIA
jgi:ATP-dependent Clp protease ATP-binding subunit ClpC